jgi:hypothetical protein
MVYRFDRLGRGRPFWQWEAEVLARGQSRSLIDAHRKALSVPVFGTGAGRPTDDSRADGAGAGDQEDATAQQAGNVDPRRPPVLGATAA